MCTMRISLSECKRHSLGGGCVLREEPQICTWGKDLSQGWWPFHGRHAPGSLSYTGHVGKVRVPQPDLTMLAQTACRIHLMPVYSGEDPHWIVTQRQRPGMVPNMP